MNSGALTGVRPFMGTYGRDGAQGSWNGNRSRMSVDEIRMFGYGDNYSQGAGRLFNTNVLPKGVSAFFTGDTGNILNIGSGTMLCNSAQSPMSAGINFGGTYAHMANSAGNPSFVQSGCFVVPQFVNTSVATYTTGIAAVLYLTASTGSSLGTGTHYDWGTNSAIDVFPGSGGAWTATNWWPFMAGHQIKAGCTVTNVNNFVANAESNGTATTTAGTVTNLVGFRVLNPTITGTVTNNIGIDVPSMSGGGTNIGIRNAGTLIQTAQATFSNASTIFNYGTSTSGGAVSASLGLVNGTSKQVAATVDAMVYIKFSTAGTAMTISVGPTSTPANTIYPSAAPNTGAMYTVRVPAGWYILVSGTSTVIQSSVYVTC